MQIKCPQACKNALGARYFGPESVPLVSLWPAFAPRLDALSVPGPPILVDTSVWTRIARRPQVASAISVRLAAGQVLCRCPLVDLELFHSARAPAEYDQWATTRAQASTSLPLTPAVGERALYVQQQLAHRGLHRAAKLPDLVIAAITETAGAGVLDSDYDHISSVTGQLTEWIVARGSIDRLRKRSRLRPHSRSTFTRFARSPTKPTAQPDCRAAACQPSGDPDDRFRHGRATETASERRRFQAWRTPTRTGP